MISFLRESKTHIFPVALDENIEIFNDEHHHLANVLRIRVGNKISAATNQQVRGYEVSEVTRNSTSLRAITDIQDKTEQEITIYISIFKIDRLELGITKAIETGATKIFYGPTNRSQISIVDKKIEKMNLRFTQIAKSAATQSRRSQIPQIYYSKNLVKEFLDNNGQKIVCEPGSSKTKVIAPVSFLIGPEGGLDLDELELCRNLTDSLSLSENILRAETAMCVAPTLVEN